MAERGRGSTGGGPTHPKLAAALLMIGVVVLLLAISALSAWNCSPGGSPPMIDDVSRCIG